MAAFSQCPRCNCKDEGTVIYKCDDCNTVFCEVCKGHQRGRCCPRCKCDGMGVLGEIQNEEDDDD